MPNDTDKGGNPWDTFLTIKDIEDHFKQSEKMRHQILGQFPPVTREQRSYVCPKCGRHFEITEDNNNSVNHYCVKCGWLLHKLPAEV